MNPAERPLYAVTAPELGGPALGAPEPAAPEPPLSVAKPRPAHRFLTDVIVELGLAPRPVVDEALERSRANGVPPERILLEDGAINSDGLARARAERYGLEHLDLNVYNVDPVAANLLAPDVARRYEALPVALVDEGTLLVAMSDPANVLAVDDIAIITGREVRVAVAATDDIIGLIGRLDRLGDDMSQARSKRRRPGRDRSRRPSGEPRRRPGRARWSTRSSSRPSNAERRTSTSRPRVAN